MSEYQDPSEGDYVVSWDRHLVRIRFVDQQSAEMFAHALRVQGHQVIIAYVPKGREDQAYLVPEVPL